MRSNTSIINIYVSLMIAIFISFGCATFKGKPQANEDPFDIKINSEADKTILILSEQIYLSMQEQKKRKIAVMSFSSPTGEITELDVFLSDKLTNGLFKYKDKFEIIERTHLRSALKEMELSSTGIIDNKTAQSIGKFLGADAIVVGTLTDLNKQVDINIRLIDTERANVIAIANSLLKKDEAIEKLMSNIITESNKDKNDSKKITKDDKKRQEEYKKAEPENEIMEDKRYSLIERSYKSPKKFFKIAAGASYINNFYREFGSYDHSKNSSISVLEMSICTKNGWSIGYLYFNDISDQAAFERYFSKYNFTYSEVLFYGAFLDYLILDSNKYEFTLGGSIGSGTIHGIKYPNTEFRRAFKMYTLRYNIEYYFNDKYGKRFENFGLFLGGNIHHIDIDELKLINLSKVKINGISPISLGVFIKL